MKPLTATILYLLCAVNSIISEPKKDTQLLQASVFFRHGARTPELADAIPTDPYNFTSMGWGQLTKLGKQKSYKLGQVLRKRYARVLGPVYVPGMIKAQSTDVDRTKMTLLLVLAGLFPPTDTEIWNNSIPWQPIPYDYFQKEQDYTFRMANSYCPAYKNELEKVLSSAFCQRALMENRNLSEYIEKHAGKPIRSLLDILFVYQTLKAEATMNLTLPDWSKSVFPYPIENVTNIMVLCESYNSLLKRLSGGRVLGKVIDCMVNKSRGLGDTKLYLYSGHDFNVFILLAALNLFEPHIPNYNAALMIELHFEMETRKYGVKVFYLKDVELEPELLKLEGCENFCPLDIFMQITQPHIPVNYTAECQSLVDLG